MKRPGGFTLIEILVAVAIFAVLTTLCYGALNQAILASEALNERMDRLQALQRTMRQLADDFQQLAPRPIRDELGDNYRPALDTGYQGGFALELTRSGWSNPLVLPRSTMQRVAYRIEDGVLIRYRWLTLDRTLGNEPVGVEMLDEVQNIRFRFMQSNGEFVEQWPPLSSQGGPDLRQRPRAVEILVQLESEGELTRLIEVAP